MTSKPEHSEHLLAEVERQISVLRRGTVQILSEEELRRKLKRSLATGQPLRIKLGVDPTAHDLHLGFTLPLTKLRLFSDLGHQPVLIIGDATAMVGDPTGRNQTRPQLTKEEVDGFAASYLEQAAKIVDMDKVEVRRNSEWLHALGFTGFIKLAARATVAQMLVRDDFSKRFADGAPIYLHELMYPLMQGWDSVVVRADVELGGQDQLFNLTVGRDLLLAEGQEAQVCMMGPMLVGLDGVRKMSKSYKNYIGISEPPAEMFGKIMSLPDEMMSVYFELVTLEDTEKVKSWIAEGVHPRELKERLGKAIVARFHDSMAAESAAQSFRRIFTEREKPVDIPETVISNEHLDGGRIGIVRLLTLSGLVATNNEARRLVRDGGVRVNDVVKQDEKESLVLEDGAVLNVGKRRFIRVRVQGPF